MRRIAVLFQLVLLSCFSFAQVLDGVYVKEHIPLKKNPEIRVSYPVPLDYTFSDRESYDCIKDTLPSLLKNMKKYPSFEGSTFVHYHITETAALIEKMPEQSCRLLFYKLFKNSGGIRVESYAPPFLKFQLQHVQLIDSATPLFSLQVKPFLQKYMSPFFIKNTEVTNAEYREFVNDLKDSIARNLLFKAGIQRYIKKDENSGKTTIRKDIAILWKGEEERKALATLFRPEDQRYYKRREIDVEQLQYELDGKIINIYPDTLCADHRIPYTYNDPFWIMYFWHPGYDYYPVVGLTRDQILAYLDWKTKKENKLLAAQHKPYRLKFKLPDEMQWELASALQLYQKDAEFGWYLSQAADHSYRTGLFLTYPEDTFLINENQQLYGVLAPSVIKDINGSGTITYYDSRMGTSMVTQTNDRKPKWPKNVIGLNNNVSEYLDEELNEMYSNLLKARWELFSKFKGTALEYIAMQEKMLFEMTCDGKYLVRGGNWLDERKSVIEGMNVKCFVSGKETYPTLGFRYAIEVIWVNP